MSDLDALGEVSRRVRWLSAAIVDAANRGRADDSGVKTGGHQASSASMVDIAVALWFDQLTSRDRVSVKPHASPVLHAINHLLGDLDASYLSTLRAEGGLQSYPSRSKDPDTVDFSTGSVGIGATATVWAAIAHRYLRSHVDTVEPAGRFISLLGDAELDEGAIWEAVADPQVARLGEVLWVVDMNRQSLDRVVPDIATARLEAMFEAAGWQVLTIKWGRLVTALFEREGGDALRRRLEDMPNEEYQRMLRVRPDEVAERLLAGEESAGPLARLVHDVPEAELAAAVRDLGGHDLGLLVDTFADVDTDRPTVVFAYTLKGRGLPTEGHPQNHSALLTEEQMQTLAQACGTDLGDPWAPLPDGPAAALCDVRRTALARQPATPGPVLHVPRDLGHPHRKPVSTQSALGRLLTDLVRDAPDVAERVVTASPDVASSTNLGGWINKSGVWATTDRRDWFADDAERLLRWSEDRTGRHIELGIAEVNLVGLAAELGSTWSRWDQRLIPVATLYDPFVARALEPWSFGMYAGGQSIVVGTPSGVTLAPEGGAHQSVTTPSIGLEQPGCVAWEPAFAQDLEWCFLHAMSRVGVPGGTSAYFRLSTRPLDPTAARVPEEPELRERRRRQAVAGGYRLSEHPAGDDDVTLVGVGAVLPEVLAAADLLRERGIGAGVVCLTSPDLVFRSFQQRGSRAPGDPETTGVLDLLLPPEHPAPLVTVQDGHPHTLAFLAGARGDRVRCLGVTEFGHSSGLAEAYAHHGLDAGAVTGAALDLLGR